MVFNTPFCENPEGSRKDKSLDFDPQLVTEGASLVARALKGDKGSLEILAQKTGLAKDDKRKVDILAREEDGKIIAYVRSTKEVTNSKISEDPSIAEDPEAAAILAEMPEGESDTIPGLWVGKTISREKKQMWELIDGALGEDADEESGF